MHIVHFHRLNFLLQMDPAHLNWVAIVFLLVFHPHRNRFLFAHVVREFFGLMWEMHFLCWYFVCTKPRRMAFRNFPQSTENKRIYKSWLERKFMYRSFRTFTPRSFSTIRCVGVASHLFPANTFTTSGAAFWNESKKN